MIAVSLVPRRGRKLNAKVQQIKVPGNEAMIAVHLTDFEQDESVKEQKAGEQSGNKTLKQPNQQLMMT